jgi:hypothetical protein
VLGVWVHPHEIIHSKFVSYSPRLPVDLILDLVLAAAVQLQFSRHCQYLSHKTPPVKRRFSVEPQATRRHLLISTQFSDTTERFSATSPLTLFFEKNGTGSQGLRSLTPRTKTCPWGPRLWAILLHSLRAGARAWTPTRQPGWSPALQLESLARLRRCADTKRRATADPRSTPIIRRGGRSSLGASFRLRSPSAVADGDPRSSGRSLIGVGRFPHLIRHGSPRRKMWGTRDWW